MREGWRDWSGDWEGGGFYERMRCMGLAAVLGLRTASMSSFFYEGSFVSLGG